MRRRTRPGPGDLLRPQFTSAAGLARLDAGEISLIQHPATELEPGFANVYLRVRHDDASPDGLPPRDVPQLDGAPHETPPTNAAPAGWGAHRYAVHPLTGPACGGRVSDGGTENDGPLVPRSDALVAGPTVTGHRHGLRYCLTWVQATTAPAWAWQVEVVNESDRDLDVDLVATLDAALAPWDAVRRNEYYVSQYLDLSPVTTERYGVAVAVRQNMPGKTAPWVVLGSLHRGVAWATDARQLTERSGQPGWTGLTRDLPSARLQHEHTLAAVQDEGRRLEPGRRWSTGFFGWYLPDHQAATGPQDAALIDATIGDILPGLGVSPTTRPVPAHADDPAYGDPAYGDPAYGDPAQSEPVHGDPAHGDPVRGFGRPVTPTLFGPLRVATGDEVSDAVLTEWVPGPRRHLERPPGSEPHSPPWAFVISSDDPAGESTPGSPVHLVARAKEVAVLRPHGHLLRSPANLSPSPAAAVSTCWMRGVFLCYLAQGHASSDVLLSLRRGYLDVQQAHGVRAFVDIGDGTWRLLGLPSAWAVEPQCCRWWYRLGDTTLLVTTTADPREPRFGVRLERLDGPRCRILLAVGLSGHVSAPHPGAVTAWRGLHALDLRPDSPLAARYPGGRLILEWSSDAPGTPAGDEVLFADGISRGLPWWCLRTETADRIELRVQPALAPSAAPGPAEPTTSAEHAAPPDPAAPTTSAEHGAPPDPAAPTTSAEHATPPDPADPGSQAARLPTLIPAPPSDDEGASLAAEALLLNDALSWLRGDALVHYLTPRGLEQYSGGAWGTRDVCQGPVGLLLAADRLAELRALILRIFAAQRDRGPWGQWFDFLPAHVSSDAADSAGDIPYWPLLALGEYLLASADATVLEERLPYRRGGAEPVTDPADTRAGSSEPLLAHVERALSVLEASVTADRRLPAYGQGDWNDALQPADPRLSAHLSSTWTATLLVHAFETLAEGLEGLAHPDRRTARAADVSARLRIAAASTRAGIRDVMLYDGELAGYVLLDRHGQCGEHLVHPADRHTGLTHGLLPAIHAISGELLTPDEAAEHLRMIRDRLHGPDGAHLFDRPTRYAGGPMTVFQRTEAATFWGREIGLMYTHAHLRYVEALARYGAAQEAFTELLRVIPLGITDRVASAAPRQSTCYASSSDARFTDRYDAARRYPQALAGAVPLEAGWRVYSSGPGLTLRLVTETLLGWRRRPGGFAVDPCLPPGLDGLRATLPALGPDTQVRYRIGRSGVGVRAVRVGGRELPTTPLRNRYREPGVLLSAADLANLPAGSPGSPRLIDVSTG